MGIRASYRRLPKTARRIISTAIKLLVTIGGFYLLLTHKVPTWSSDDLVLLETAASGEVSAVRTAEGETIPAVSDEDALLRAALDDARAYLVEDSRLRIATRGPGASLALDGFSGEPTWTRTKRTLYTNLLESKPSSVVLSGSKPFWKVWAAASAPVELVRVGSVAEVAEASQTGSEAGGVWAWDETQGALVVSLSDGTAPGKRVRTAEHGAIGQEAIGSAIVSYVEAVEPTTFFLFAFLAMAIKFVGVISSAYAWNLLLKGQGLRFPFWQQVFTAFLIGRFIGTFLPSTIGLDGYTLYEAGRYSNAWHRVITAKALEKFLGIAGLFTGVLLTLPAGYLVLQGIGDGSGIVTALIGVISAGVTGTVVIGLVKPGWVRLGMRLFGGILPGPVRGHADRFVSAAGAYEGQLGLLFGALFAKFITHFTTAVVYFFTALAIGVVAPEFLPIVFGSLLQIFGTIFSPTIAGEGAREALQAMLLSNYLGGPAQAVLSAALGFVAAEAATLWGGAFLWTRGPDWRPTSCLVDGEQVDYAWLEGDEGGFDAEKIAETTRSHR